MAGVSSAILVQVYGGLVYMDFQESHMKQHGHGRCVCCVLRLETCAMHTCNVLWMKI